MRGAILSCALAAAALGASPAAAQQGDGTDVAASIHIFKPNKVPVTSERIAAIKAPEGFTVAPFAAGLTNVRVLAVAPDGTVYASRRDQGDVVMLRDEDGDGKADAGPVVVANRAGTHGLAIHDGKLYIATVHEIFAADIRKDGTLGPLTMLLGDLPDAGQHANRTIAFGPDGMLYASVGSTCNACNEPNPENATILRIEPDGKSRTIFARGLRNTIGFDWSPATGELWGMDHGIDFLGDEVQPEELNRIERGNNYGWPHVWGADGINPQSTPEGDISKAQWKAQSTPMVMGYAAHAAPMQMVFYRGSAFPQAYRGDAFVTMRGSWNRNPASGYEVVRIHFEDGQPKSIEPFVTGFLTDDGKTHIARPVGLAEAKDGSLLMSDDANGVIYRIAATNAKAADDKATLERAPAGPMEEQASAGSGVPLLLERPEAQGSARLDVVSPTIDPNGLIPPRHSAYRDDASPALSWTPVKGAASYAIVVEDPDAKPTTPFVHWVAWNIPATVTELPEGLQTQPRLTAPEGVLQGRTSRGSVGYYGPRPPVGDAPHHYHFQLLALDALLDVPPGSDRDAVLAAAKGHVIATGELVGRFQEKTQPLR